MGEHKSIQTDRVILVPGPTEEVEVVHWIYDAFVKEGRTEREIAQLLNDRGIVTDFQRPWTRGTVHEILTNEKYIGNNVYHRTSCKLKQKHIENPPDTSLDRLICHPVLGGRSGPSIQHQTSGSPLLSRFALPPNLNSLPD